MQRPSVVGRTACHTSSCQQWFTQEEATNAEHDQAAPRFRNQPGKVYRAFIEADALAKWLPPNGFTCTVHHLEGKVGGAFRMSFRNFTTGNSHAFGGEYLELVPGERVRYTDTFDDPNLPGTMEVTVTLKKVSVGTEIDIIQAGVPDLIPAEACYLGWQESLRNLAKLVEPEITE